MSKIIDFIKARFGEKSTQRTILTGILSAIGVAAAPEHVEVILTATTIVLSWIGFITPEAIPGKKK